jgi:multiple sugar transport system ATP-binding protein
MRWVAWATPGASRCVHVRNRGPEFPFRFLWVEPFCEPPAARAGMQRESLPRHESPSAATRHLTASRGLYGRLVVRVGLLGDAECRREPRLSGSRSSVPGGRYLEEGAPSTRRRPSDVAEVKLTNVNKIYQSHVPEPKAWFEFWKPSSRKRDVHVVHDVNLEIRDGEFLVLVGPSGCGKSTTLRMIAGLEDISGGSISIGGRVVNDLSPKDRDIAMVFQNYALYPHMNVRDNMAFGLRLRKMPEAEIATRVQEAAALLKIEALLARKPKELSGGQRQRVAMGRAIVRRPQVFLMDEPLSNLDAKLRVQMRAELQKLHRTLGVTTVYVTHDQTEAMTLGHRIVLMRDGVIQQADTPLELYEKPANQYVAGFIGLPPMNFLTAEVRVEGDEVWLRGEGFGLRVPAGPSRDLQAYGGKPVTLGLRAEDLHDAQSAVSATDGTCLEAQVEVLEALGSEVNLHLGVGAATLVARVQPHTSARVGEPFKIWVDMRKLHVFDPGSEQAIVHGASYPT